MLKIPKNLLFLPPHIELFLKDFIHYTVPLIIIFIGFILAYYLSVPIFFDNQMIDIPAVILLLLFFVSYRFWALCFFFICAALFNYEYQVAYHLGFIFYFLLGGGIWFVLHHFSKMITGFIPLMTGFMICYVVALMGQGICMYFLDLYIPPEIVLYKIILMFIFYSPIFYVIFYMIQGVIWDKRIYAL